MTRADEHVLDKVGLPCELGDEANRRAGLLVGSAESIRHIKVLAGEIFDNLSIQLVENFGSHRLVDLTPGNILEGWFLMDKILVLG